MVIRSVVVRTFAVVLLFLLPGLVTAQSSSNFSVGNVNDWGSGFNASFQYTISAEDAPLGTLDTWQIEINNLGTAQINNSSMSGFNGSVSAGPFGPNGEYVITNESAGYKPLLASGDPLNFTISGQGSGFNESDFDLTFTNLALPASNDDDSDQGDTGQGETEDEAGTDNTGLTSSFVSVNDWYNPASGGGFNATFECAVAGDSPVTEIFVNFNYSGSGTPSSAWAQSYNGQLTTGLTADNGGYSVSGNNASNPLNPGDRFQVVVQVNGAGFDESDFDVLCATEDSATEDNIAPVADAGNDVSVSVGTEVTLNGSASTDAEGDPLTFDWNIVELPQGSASSLSDPDGVMTSFVVDAFGEYRIRLMVNDGTTDSLPDDVLVSTINSIPVANAGADQQAFVGDQVVLDGSESTDADGDTIVFVWSLISAPAGSTASLSVSDDVRSEFVPDLTGEYLFELVVSDDMESSEPDAVAVNVETMNTLPVADAGEDQTAVVGETVVLSGAASSDVDGNSLTYQWSVLSQPESSTSVPLPVDGLTSSLLIDAQGEYLVQLVVNDGISDSEPSTLLISTDNSKPTAEIVAATTSPLNEAVTLAGSASIDPDGDTLSYDWSILTRPAVSTVEIDIPDASSILLTPDFAGLYVIQLIVSDGVLSSDPVTHSVEFIASEALALVAISPLSDSVINTEDSVTVTLTANQAVTGTVDGQSAVSDIDNTIAVTVELVEGENTIEINLQNEAGDSITETITLYRDTVAPTVPNIADITVVVTTNAPTADNNEIQVSGSAGSVESGSIVTVTNITDGDSVSVTADADGSFLATVPGGAADDIEITLEDAVMNQSDSLIITGSNVDPTNSSTISGVITTDTDTPITGATVSAVDRLTGTVITETQSTADGSYTLVVDAETEYVLNVTSPGFSDQITVVESDIAATNQNVSVVLFERLPAVEFSEDVGGQIQGESGASVTVSGNSFEEVLGSSAVMINITPIDPAAEEASIILPGESRGITLDGASSTVEHLGSVEIVFTDTQGQVLDLLPGVTAEIIIPIFINNGDTSLSVGDVVPVWSLNESTSTWEEEGTGVVVTSADSPTGFGVLAEVSHFTYYSVGRPNEAMFAPLELIIAALMGMDSDSDGDGVPDSADAFPEDPNETLDSDGDGVGDNTDDFPENPSFQYAAECVPGTYVKDNLCIQAPPGYFSLGSSSAEGVLACEFGTYSAQSGNTSCEPAPVGYYVDYEAATEPTRCPQGQTTSLTGSVSREDCFTEPQLGEAVIITGGPVSPLVPEVVASPEQAVPSTLAFGDITDSVSVDAMGGLSYSVPIPLQMAPGGLTPDISLSYNSNQSSGLFGVGTSLAGLRSVTRCKRSYAKDGMIGPISFDDDDAFCLDGQRLILGTDGTYSTENQQFSRINAIDMTPSGPTSWEVIDRGGNIYLFGKAIGDQTENDLGRIEVVDAVSGDATSIVHKWMLSSVTNPLGHNYRAYYYEDKDASSPNTHHILEYLRYGLDASTAIEVRFDYHDQESLYPDDRYHNDAFNGGYRFSKKRYVKKITVKRSTTEISAYYFDYEIDFGFSDWRLEKVRVCAFNSTCLPAKKLHWQDRDINSSRSSGAWQSHGNFGWNTVTGDFNGDGRTDIAALELDLSSGNAFTPTDVVKICLSTGSDFECSSQNPWPTGDFPTLGEEIALPYNFPETKAYRPFVGDFDGNGLDDFIFPKSTESWIICETEPATTGSSEISIQCDAPSNSLLSGFDTENQVGDFNGDGISDIFNSENHRLCFGGADFFQQSKISTDCITATLADVNFPGGVIAARRTGFLYGDFNGDGATDIFSNGPDDNVLYNYPMLCLSVQPSAGEYQCDRPVHVPSHKSWELGDFNGDGLTDIAMHNQSGRWAVHYSSGVDFLPAVERDGYAKNSADVAVGDFNGDGRSDLAGRVTDSEWFINYSGPNDFVAWSEDPEGTDSVDPLPTPFTRNVILGDFDGDGRTDFAGISRVVDGSFSPGEHIHVVLQSAHSIPVLSAVSRDSTSITKVFDVNYAYTASEDYLVMGYPRRPVNGNVHVVRSIEKPNAKKNAGADTVLYDYGVFRVDLLGLGVLGFDKRAETDVRRGTKTTYHYRQDYPFTGLISEMVDSILVGDEERTLKSTQTEYELVIGGVSSDSNDFVVPYLRERTEGFHVRKLSDTSESYDYYTSEPITKVNNSYQVYDEWSNNEELQTVVTDKTIIPNLTWTTKTKNTFDNFAGDNRWQIGLLRESTVYHTSTAPGANTRPVTKKSSFDYYDNGQLKYEIVEPDKVQTSEYLKTSYKYDDVYGDVTEKTLTGHDREGDSIQRSTATETAYLSQGSMYPRPVKRVIVTNDKNQSVTVESDLNHGGAVYEKDLNGLETSHIYNGFGELEISDNLDASIKTEIRRGWVAPNAIYPADSYTFKIVTPDNAPVVTEYYDYEGKVLRSETSGFDSTGLINRDTEYDAIGRVQYETLPYYSAYELNPRRTTYEYEGTLDRVIRTVNDLGVVSTSKVTSHQERNFSDGREQVIKRYANGQVYRIDSGYPAAEGSEDTRSTLEFTYDAAGRRVATKDEDGNETSTVYDLRDRKTKQTDPDMGAWEYAYNSFGELEWQKDAIGSVSFTQYDVLGRVVEMRTTPGNSQLTSNAGLDSDQQERTQVNVYDVAEGKGLGLIAYSTYQRSGTNHPHHKITHVYDTLSRIDNTVECVGEGVSEPCSVGEFETSYEYDPELRRLVKTNLPNGYSVERKYVNHQLKEIVRNDGKSIWKIDSKDARDRAIKTYHGNGVETIYDYSGQHGKLSGIVAQKMGGATLVDQNYVYEFGAGLLYSRTDNLYSLSEIFTYDEHLRINSVTQAYHELSSQWKYSYDRLGNLQGRSDKSELGGDGFVYGQGIEVNGAGIHAIKSIGDRSFKYNENGNLLSNGLQSVSWTAFNKPISISKGNTRIDFTYGLSNSRLTRTESNKTTTYLSGGDAAMIEREIAVGSGNVIWRYQYTVGGRIVATDRITIPGDGTPQVEQRLYMHHDHLGSVVAVSNSNGASFAQYSFDVWGDRREIYTDGEVLTATTLLLAKSQSRGYTGHEMLDSVSLVHMNGRIYDPVIGRFLSADPFVQFEYNTQSYNRYSYVLNNPVGAVDPSGYMLRADEVRRGWRRERHQQIATGVVIAGLSLATGAAASGLIANQFLGAVVGGAVSGRFSVWASGGGVAGGLSGTQAAFYGAFSAGVANTIGSAAATISWVAKYKPLLHIASQAAIADIRGQNAQSAALSALAANVSPSVTVEAGVAADVAISATLGGLASVASGGRFVDGALTAGFVRLFNHNHHPYSKTLDSPVGNARISSLFKANRTCPGCSPVHGGTDYAVPVGTDVVATADGVVVRSYTSASFGETVILDHGAGATGGGNVFTLYAHGDVRSVSVGDQVGVGQVIMTSGNSGRSTGPHLHYEVIKTQASPTSSLFYRNLGQRYAPQDLKLLLP